MWQLFGHIVSLDQFVPWGTLSDVPTSEAAEGRLASGCRRSSGASSLVTGVHRVHSLLVSRGEVVIRGSFPGSSSLSHVIH